MVAYVVEEKDTLFTIADKFALTPETVLWANRYLLGDTRTGLSPVEAFILPDNGVYHGWSYKENLDKVAAFYNVSRDVILDEPLNQLDRSAFSDLITRISKPARCSTFRAARARRSPGSPR